MRLVRRKLEAWNLSSHKGFPIKRFWFPFSVEPLLQRHRFWRRIAAGRSLAGALTEAESFPQPSQRSSLLKPWGCTLLCGSKDMTVLLQYSLPSCPLQLHLRRPAPTFLPLLKKKKFQVPFILNISGRFSSQKYKRDIDFRRDVLFSLFFSYVFFSLLLCLTVINTQTERKKCKAEF